MDPFNRVAIFFSCVFLAEADSFYFDSQQFHPAAERPKKLVGLTINVFRSVEMSNLEKRGGNGARVLRFS